MHLLEWVLLDRALQLGGKLHVGQCVSQLALQHSHPEQQHTPHTHLWVGASQLLQATCWRFAKLPQSVQRVQQLVREVGVFTELLLKMVKLFAELQLLVVTQRFIHAPSCGTTA